MEYLTFVEELKKHILKNEKWNISEENYKFYPDGYNAESDIEKEFIRNTNVKYNHVESDTKGRNHVIYLQYLVLLKQVFQI